MTVVVVTLVLLLGNAFFVGAEFSAMAARRSQLEPLAAEGSVRARTALAGMERMGSMLAAAQLGITLCSVLLGAYSESALHHVFEGPLEHLGIPLGVASGVALVIALLLVVYLHVVVGEMIPKNLALAGPDRAALAFVPPLLYFTRALAPVIRALEAIAKGMVRRLGIEPKDEMADEFTAEQVHHIVEESHREGLVEDDQLGLVGAALEFSDKDAADVAVPLDGLVTVPRTASPDDIEHLVAKHGFSRFPTVDDDGLPAGYLHLKDVLYADDDEREAPIPRKRIRRLATVAAGDAVEDVLRTMQSTGSHLARVIDPAGQVVGVVFLEDVIEELVGEVSDAEQR
ncbi:Hemolysin containing CBS domains protein [Nostocoides japonicum T1-X7]|uniref:Hemolysin containing CBS domains protein n=1 Tax=Nostocoides japonicum T1-X7 TaxID=1194083 RepID=A0A077M0V9_9MICO|nr:hemolysin family protein [Tetrasphaera japonica]CCH78712.1 Hemolysin containing CBS domains protein [Tetrasphaera japonica T1-X7]